MATVTIHKWVYANGSVGYNLRTAEGNDAFSYLYGDEPAKDGGSAEYLLPEGFEVRNVGDASYFYHVEHSGDIATTTDGNPGIRTATGIIPLVRFERKAETRETVTIFTWLYESGEVGFSMGAAPEHYSDMDLDPAKDGGSAEYLLPEGFELKFRESGVPVLWYKGEYPTISFGNVDGLPAIKVVNDLFPLTLVE